MEAFKQLVASRDDKHLPGSPHKQGKQLRQS
jgi:hypothetical protein